MIQAYTGQFLLAREGYMDEDGSSIPSEKDVDFALIDNNSWAPPEAWDDYSNWSPRPKDPRPDYLSKWLMHLWSHRHNSLVYLFSKRIQSNIRTRYSYTLKNMRYYRGIMSAPSDCENHSIRTTIEEIPLPHLPVKKRQPGTLIVNETPKRLRHRLEARSNTKPYGWGIHFEESIVVPKFVMAILLSSFIALIIYTFKLFPRDGYAIFGLGNFSLASAGLLLTMIQLLG